MAVVRRQEGDKTKVNANGVLVITRANGNVVKFNGPKGTITRIKTDGTKIKQKATAGPTAPMRKTGSAYGSKVRWNVEVPAFRVRKPKKAPASTMRAR
jgi:hypothetical protein